MLQGAGEIEEGFGNCHHCQESVEAVLKYKRRLRYDKEGLRELCEKSTDGLRCLGRGAEWKNLE